MYLDSFCSEVFTEICLQSLCAWKMFLLWWQCTENNSVAASKLLPLTTSQSWHVLLCSYAKHCRSPVARWIWIPPWKRALQAFSRPNKFCAIVKDPLLPWCRAAQHSTDCAVSVLLKTGSDFTYAMNWIPYCHTFWALRVPCEALHSFCES